ncbi:putative molybdenum cofactor sulfurtransferase [Helianthus annuus]|uniref:Molybdenum cofactor sulfurtransferase n=1 Tax=Helianthus annuus TaxID=4232 RepID=A0A251SSD9_HELAN|nr:molybdenum cofactor sulfurase [Helianthus annuus]KAF5773650.1 putative molybdenum cofactor sulfurtransferase [Helianthus annuus]KAJ0481501.1 putative molybdenum cofactor sulfurtransferase [Helianthus annuus]KAJ0497946.1 putative molybdenum cofactor sulfurtransferase [Helianthus annuus]KAJ0663952.1 putative molybdenum cofactor sulfurtransferase [Helianthus annuus]KAJ0849470.1 putative molybdenum cofactor sulfurtransferase [Helianthus annuus]
MNSPCLKHVEQVCSHGCCSNPLFSLPDFTTINSTSTTTTTTTSTSSACRKHFTTTTTTSFFPNTRFTDHESLPSYKDSLITFTQTYPKYSDTARVDRIRGQEYYHLSLSNRICLDYIGIGLFSHLQLQTHHPSTPSSSDLHSDFPFFNTIYRSVNLKSQLLHGGEGSPFESCIRKRIMEFMNVSGDDYSMVFTSNKSSAFKIVSESYPFQTSRKLLTVYDYNSEAVDTLVTTSEKRGAKVMSAEFKWPRMRIHSAKLRKMVERNRKKKKPRGLFVFPLQSRTTGASYSYQWMLKAQENGWHVLLDACALGPKDMDSFGLSLIRPDFLICSFYKVFGENPSGFGCLFVKKSMISILEDSCVGIATLVPAKNSSFQAQSDEEHSSGTDLELQQEQIVTQGEKNKGLPIEYRGLDHVDSLGLMQISTRTRCLINWLINALTKLEHPNTETKTPLIKIYGPRIRFDRGPALAFNIYDWKGEKVEPALVQKLSDRNNISLSVGSLHKIWFDDKYVEEKERVMTEGGTKKSKGVPDIAVVTAAINFLANFEDVYRLWAFVARFLDADYVEKERWRYTALNQKTIEV